MTTIRRLVAFASFLVVLAACHSASAFDYGNAWGGSTPFGVWGYGFSGNLYGLGRIPTPPYFALHPPVYYGERIRRPYGDSPFAHSTGRYAQTAPVSVVVVNSHVPQASSNEAAPAQAQIIENPYVARAESSPSDAPPEASK